MAHTCKALIIHCIDFRLQPALREYLENKKLFGSVDVVSIAGAVKDLVRSDQPQSAVLFRQVQISHNLHAIKEVYLVNHTDCGAYGGHEAFLDEQQEISTHTDDLRTARAIIGRAFPGLKVTLLIAEIQSGHGAPKVEFVAVS